MKKTDYKLIVDNIRNVVDLGGDAFTLRIFAEGLCLDLSKSDPKFNRELFLSEARLTNRFVKSPTPKN